MFRRRRVEKALRALDPYYREFLSDHQLDAGPVTKCIFLKAALDEVQQHENEDGLDEKARKYMVKRLEEMINIEYNRFIQEITL